MRLSCKLYVLMLCHTAACTPCDVNGSMKHGVLAQAVMKEPVIAADEHTYEKAAIMDWLQLHVESPVTGEVLSDHTVLPNIDADT